MGVLNRRNAVIGWAVWKLTKTVAARKAKRAVQVESGGGKKRGIGAGVVSALAAVGGALWFWRRKRGADDTESATPKPTS